MRLTSYHSKLQGGSTVTISAVLQTVSLHDSSLNELKYIPDEKTVLMSIDLCSQDPSDAIGNPVPGILKFEGVEELRFEREYNITGFSEILDAGVKESTSHSPLECIEILIEDRNDYVKLWITALDLSWNPA
jgi:hypothetical protein